MVHPSPLEQYPRPRTRKTSVFEKGLIRMGEAGDDLLIGFQKLLLRNQTQKKKEGRAKEPEDSIDLNLYTRPELLSDPRRFYPAPGAPIDVRRKVIAKMKGGVRESLKFPSLYQTYHPDYREAYREYKENQTGHALWWRHKDGGRPTLLVVHGWMAGDHRLHRYEFLMPWLFEKLGLDIVFFQQPFHGKRMPKQSRFSGQLFPSTNPARTNEGFGQSVYDLRCLLRWLEDQGAGRIGCMGSSLGGYVTALLASTEEKLDFAIPIIPPAAISDLFWEQGKGTPRRKHAEERGVTADVFRKLLAVNSPLLLKPLVPKERRFIIAGLGDRLVPPSHPYALWRHWDECQIHWFPGGHVTQFRRGEYFREIRKFLHGIKVI
ncbi:MAG: alpha/beta hydrolase family protein [Bdellovibrionota bacterium]